MYTGSRRSDIVGSIGMADSSASSLEWSTKSSAALLPEGRLIVLSQLLY